MSSIQTRREVLLNKVVATTTSRGVGIDNAGRASIQLKAENVISGTGTFTVDVSNDGGATYTAYQRLIPNLVGSNSQTDAYVASKVLNSTGSSMIFISAGDTFEVLRVTCTFVTDGSYSATLYLN